MDRLTTDNPKTNTETLLNYAFGKENKVYLRESEEGLELCEYVAGLCSGNAGCISEEDIMDGACMDCRGCSAGALYFCAVQAAELRARLKAYEDTGLTPKQVAAYAKAEAEGRLIVLPCKVGDELWVNDRNGKPRRMILDAPDIRCHCANEDNLCMVTCDNPRFGFCAFRLKNDGGSLGKTVFTSREAAEAALKEVQE